jgi:homoserine dehydrogenase
LLGFGNVNRALVRLLQKKEPELSERGIGWRVTGIATRRLGWIVHPQLDTILGDSFSPGSVLMAAGPRNLEEWLEAAQPDVIFEATSLSPWNGQPAIHHIRAALEFGAHAITANKGPIVHAYEELSALARSKDRRFLFEATVMDGVPVFSMFRENLPGIELRGFHGILNSTTNLILSGMEEGLSFKDSLRKAQAAGVAETDPSNDVDGWDAAVKIAALVRVLMGVSLRLEDIKRKGIAKLTGEAVREARAAGNPYKLVCRAKKMGTTVRASVRPEQVPLSDPMASVAGTSSILCLETDIFPELIIRENNPELEATAYGMFADFVKAVG